MPPDKWNTHPKRSIFPLLSGFKDFLPDSGATSHFTGDLSDLINPTPHEMEVTIADGTTVKTTHVGRADINFVSDNGFASTLELAQIYYIPGLSRRLFSLQAFTQDTPFTVQICHNATRLIFDDGDSYTWPTRNSETPLDRYAMNASEENEQQGLDDPNVNDRTPRPTHPIPLELGMQRLGFCAVKGLLAGSLHKVWLTYSSRS